jgi:hypothetical protein
MRLVGVYHSVLKYFSLFCLSFLEMEYCDIRVDRNLTGAAGLQPAQAVVSRMEMGNPKDR